MPKVSFNGRFLAAPQTGVQRVARELITSVMQILDETPELKTKLELQLICPPTIKHAPPRDDLKSLHFGRLSGQAWEQFELPRAPIGDLLINLCNVSPLASSRSITMIHDAQVFISPESYSRAFRTWYQFALPRIGRSARKILTVSNYSADQLASLGVAPRDKIAVVHNGVDHILNTPADTSILKKLHLSPGSFTVGLANTQAHKNVSVLIEAHRDARLTHRKLVLFGSADAAAFEAAGITLPPSVILAGRISDAELRGLLENANALVFPSKTEGFGLPPLEAMTLGTPAICASAGALPEVCGDAAVYADADDVEAWTSALDTLAVESESNRFNRMSSSKGHASAYTWKAAGQKLLDVIVEELAL